MNRRTRRSILGDLKKDQKRVEAQKHDIVKNYSNVLGHNPFDEVRIFRKYWFIDYSETGLKLAPVKTWGIKKFMFRTAYDYFAFFMFGYVIKFHNMNKRKPEPDTKFNIGIQLYKFSQV